MSRKEQVKIGRKNRVALKNIFKFKKKTEERKNSQKIPKKSNTEQENRCEGSEDLETKNNTNRLLFFFKKKKL